MTDFDRPGRIHATIPTAHEVAVAIGIPTERWPGKCDDIVQSALKTGLFPRSEARYGQYLGQIDPQSIFAKIPTRQHAWIEMPGRVIIDPTRWVFEAWEPYVAKIHWRNRRYREYDVGGIAWERRLNGSQPPGADATFGRHATPQPCPLDVVDPTAVRLIATYFSCTPDRLTEAQVFWLANLSAAELGEAARPIFQAIQKAGRSGQVPYDHWRAVME